MILSALCTLCLSIEGGIGLQDGFDHGPWSVQFGGGYQFKSRPEIQSNDYDAFLLTANVQLTFDGLFARRESVGGMDYSIVGLSTGWGY